MYVPLAPFTRAYYFYLIFSPSSLRRRVIDITYVRACTHIYICVRAFCTRCYDGLVGGSREESPGYFQKIRTDRFRSERENAAGVRFERYTYVYASDSNEPTCVNEYRSALRSTRNTSGPAAKRRSPAISKGFAARFATEKRFETQKPREWCRRIKRNAPGSRNRPGPLFASFTRASETGRNRIEITRVPRLRNGARTVCTTEATFRRRVGRGRFANFSVVPPRLAFVEQNRAIRSRASITARDSPSGKYISSVRGVRRSEMADHVARPSN